MSEIVASMAWALRLYAAEGRSMPEEIEVDEREEIAQPQFALRETGEGRLGKESLSVGLSGVHSFSIS